MRLRNLILIALGLSELAALAQAIPRIRMREAFPNLQFERPVWMTQPDDGSGRFFLVEQRGVIHVFAGDPAVQKTGVFLDLTSKTGIEHNEEGLLCMALHPKYKANGKFYVYYCAQRPRRTVVSEFQVSASDPNRADPKSERVLLEVPQPYGNHKGATTLFGPDGYLYVSLGDGGSGGDPHNNAQSLDTLLGKIIRIDVDSRSGALQYGIPRDNPFAAKSGARPEIWAYGLRNVWRMSFDRKTGDLWAGDVGQDAWEEIDVITKGGNYGWNLREGKHPFKKGKPSLGVQLIDPVYEYGRGSGASVTGGYVYRGSRMPGLSGVYLFADYISGNFWGIELKPGGPMRYREVLRQPKNIASFAEDVSGELYAIAFDGKVYALEEGR